MDKQWSFDWSLNTTFKDTSFSLHGVLFHRYFNGMKKLGNTGQEYLGFQACILLTDTLSVTTCNDDKT